MTRPAARQEAAERVTRQFRYNGTSHQGVLEAIDKELARRESHALCAAQAAAPVSAEHVSQSSGPPHVPSVAAAGSEYTV